VRAAAALVVEYRIAPSEVDRMELSALLFWIERINIHMREKGG